MKVYRNPNDRVKERLSGLAGSLLVVGLVYIGPCLFADNSGARVLDEQSSQRSQRNHHAAQVDYPKKGMPLDYHMQEITGLSLK